MIDDWSKYSPQFRPREFLCRHTGRIDMQPEFMDRLHAARMAAGIPFVVTSGYRDKSHPEEIDKTSTGDHPKGMAADIACNFFTAWKIAYAAMQQGLTVGVSQKAGRPRFLHLAYRPDQEPGLYSY